MVITGVGCVSPAGIGQLDAALALSGTPTTNSGFRVPEFDLGDYLRNARYFRRIANSTKFALAAVSLALGDSNPDLGGEDRARTGVVIGVTHGAMGFSTLFHEELLKDGPGAASPMFFAESVLNAPAGNVAIAFGIRGPVHTVIGEETVGAQALDLALELIRSGAVDRCVVAGTEEWSGVTEGVYRQMDRVASRSLTQEREIPLLGEGAAAIVVEDAEGASRRDAAIRIPVLSVRCWRDMGESMEDSVGRIVREELAFRGVAERTVSHVVLPTGRNRGLVTRGVFRALGPASQAIRRLDIGPAAGNPFGAAALFQTAASVAWLSSGETADVGLILSSGIEKTFSIIFLGGGAG